MQKIKLNISKPCTVDWKKMTPTEQGRFCQTCATEVIDFSIKTEQEILDFFKSRTFISPCLNLTDQQLENGIPLNTQTFAFPSFIRKIAAISLIGITSIGTPILVNGQSTVEAITSDTLVPKATDKIIKIEVPATYQTYEVQKVKTPAKIIVHEVPAEYKEVKLKKITRKGGISIGWRELECVVPEKEITIEFKVLKQKLKDKGYFKGVIDNILTEEFKIALIDFKKANKLLPAFEVDNDTLYLLGLSDK